MFCQHCGANVESSRFCPRCGSAVATYHAFPPPEAARRRSLVPIALAGAAAGVVIVLLLGILLVVSDAKVVHKNSNTPADPATPSSSAAVPSTAASTPTKLRSHRKTARTKAAQASGPGDVRSLPAGLFCRDLDARGFSYSAAVDYWRMHGQPNQMDADRNGIPCETVYPSSDVAAYWGGKTLPNSSLPAGLFCRDLYARGINYPGAVAYWWIYGSPARMDADGNGIPCETVYASADVYSFWYR